MTHPRPCLEDITFAFDMLAGNDVKGLSCEAFRALMNLVRFSAAARVWTYSQPSEGWLPVDQLYSLAGVNRNDFSSIWPELSHFFETKGSLVRLLRPWIHIREGTNGLKRPALGASVRAAILQRDGFRCQYCGSDKGPFDIDHIVPISKGGAFDNEENLLTSCISCNRAKGVKTVDEWLR